MRGRIGNRLKRGNGSVVLEGSENAAWTGWKPLKIA